jgi:hypothetical protein
LHHLVSGELWLHPNAKRERYCNVHFVYAFGLITQVRNGARHTTNAVIATTRQSATLYVMT